MKKHSIGLAVQAALICSSMTIGSGAWAASDKEIAEIRAQIKEMRSSYEARLQALEQRLQEEQAKNARLASEVAGSASVAKAAAQDSAEAKAKVAEVAAAAPAPAPARSATPAANLFNPAVSMILVGSYANLSQDPQAYRLQGFVPAGGEAGGPLKRGFGIGESELTFSASVDPHFSGQMTFALDGEEAASVEEAFIQAQNLGNGLNFKFGRFFSAMGYQNSQHAHAWDFADVPLAYSALLGGQSATNGLQLKWLAPLDRFLELGVEVGNAASFPAGDNNHNGIGSAMAFAHLGGDIGDNGSWRLGLSHLHTRARERTWQDTDLNGQEASNAFSGTSGTTILDGILKWNLSGHRSLKLQGEYLRRTENGDLSSNAGLGADFLRSSYHSRQSGWYLQSVLKFSPQWRIGLRHDRLNAGRQDIAAVLDNRVDAGNFPLLASYNPRRTSLMLDWNGSEFSRIRLQYARDQSRPGVSDNQIYLQYIMSLGAHGAHSF